ncbi:MAG TPA: hypothetical protein PKZ39_09990, partial [Clostridia bacterium]|nr:hypothetical protein [Clostridia bacterium]
DLVLIVGDLVDHNPRFASKQLSLQPTVSLIKQYRQAPAAGEHAHSALHYQRPRERLRQSSRP